MNNLRTKLEQWAEREAPEAHTVKINGRNGYLECKERDAFMAATSSLIPIIERLADCLESISKATEDCAPDDHPACGYMADMALAELERFLEAKDGK